MAETELERRMVFARQAAARAWCAKETEKTEMDSILAEEFAKILVEYMYMPKLGCATTRELLAEITARTDDLDYKTIG